MAFKWSVASHIHYTGMSAYISNMECDERVCDFESA